jgi:hypothetical protein
MYLSMGITDCIAPDEAAHLDLAALLPDGTARVRHRP